MKALTPLLLIPAMMLATSCTSMRSAVVYDNVYFTPEKKAPVSTAASTGYSSVTTTEPVQAAAPAAQSSNQEYESEYYSPSGTGEYSNPETETYYDGSGNTYITNNYYDYDDYYDYAYSSRIRRFHSPMIYSSYGYYDDYYTNMYWYNYDPFCWGVSIYLGYNWWYPSWYNRPYWYWGYGHYSPYSYYYNPYYGYWGGSYWSGYNHGYHHGYWDGYYAGSYWHHNGYYDNYYNSHDRNSYYGPRDYANSSNGGRPGRGDGRSDVKGIGGSAGSFGEMYEKAVAEAGQTTGRTSSPFNNSVANGLALRSVPAEDARRNESTVSRKVVPVNTTQDVAPSGGNAVQREVVPASRGTVTSNPNVRVIREEAPSNQGSVGRPSNSETPATVNPPVERSTPATTPSNQIPADRRYEKPKTYTPPPTVKPNTSTDYTSPKSRVPQNYEPQRNSSTPAERPASSGGNNERSYSTPANSNPPTYRSNSGNTRPSGYEMKPASTPSRTPSSSPSNTVRETPRTYSTPSPSNNRPSSSPSPSSGSSSRSYDTPSRSHTPASTPSSSSSSSSRSSSSSSSSSSGSSSRSNDTPSSGGRR